MIMILMVIENTNANSVYFSLIVVYLFVLCGIEYLNKANDRLVKLVSRELEGTLKFAK